MQQNKSFKWPKFLKFFGIATIAAVILMPPIELIASLAAAPIIKAENYLTNDELSDFEIISHRVNNPEDLKALKNCYAEVDLVKIKDGIVLNHGKIVYEKGSIYDKTDSRKLRLLLENPCFKFLGAKDISNLTFDEISKLNTDYDIITLKEAIEIAKENNINLVLHLKTEKKEFFEEVYEICKELDYTYYLHMISSNEKFIEGIEEEHPEIITGCVIAGDVFNNAAVILKNRAENRDLKVDEALLEEGVFDSKVVENLIDKGLYVTVWGYGGSYDQIEDINNAISVYGVKCVITDEISHITSIPEQQQSLEE